MNTRDFEQAPGASALQQQLGLDRAAATVDGHQTKVQVYATTVFHQRLFLPSGEPSRDKSGTSRQNPSHCLGATTTSGARGQHAAYIEQGIDKLVLNCINTIPY